jgi:DNA-binding response OmpR family regulator
VAQVLLIEPDARLGNTYASGLRMQQHAVVLCNTAQDAICEADQQRPDVVVLELQLTRHSGIEFLYEFRSYPDWQDIPVIILSHVPPNEFAQSRDLLHRRLGVRAYHYKPQTNLRTLLQAVAVVLTDSTLAPTPVPVPTKSVV